MLRLKVQKKQNKALKWFAYKRYKPAYTLFREAAKQGHPYAQRMVGQMGCHGIGVKKNVEQGMYWYIEAANRNCMEAQTALGDIYYYGFEVEPDCGKSIYYYTLAAKQGWGEAIVRLKRNHSIEIPEEEMIEYKGWYW